MNDNTIIRKMSVPMRWLALAAAVEVGLVVLAATAVQSEPIQAASVNATAPGPLVVYAKAVSKALVRAESAVLPMADQP